jgi:uncharacterized membrane protein
VCTIWYMKFEASTEISAPAQRVWEIFSDVERWPEWTDSITSVERLDAGPFRVGSRARIRQPKLPVATWEVTELVEGESFTWVARGPGITTVAVHRVRAVDGGAEVSNAVEQRGPLGAVFGLLYRGLTMRYLNMELASLKKLSESVV